MASKQDEDDEKQQQQQNYAAAGADFERGGEAAAHQHVPAAPELRCATTWRRWPVLLAICTAGLCSGLTDEVASYLKLVVGMVGMKQEKFVFVQTMISYPCAVLPLVAAWYVNKFGLRMALLTRVLFICIQNCLRALFFSPATPLWANLRAYYWYSSHFVWHFNAAIFYCLPLHVSESWFPANERSYAWTLMQLMPTFGGALASLTVPAIVKTVDDVHVLSVLNLTALYVTAGAILFGVTRSRPRHPPNERVLQRELKLKAESAATKTGNKSEIMSLPNQLRRLWRCKQLMLHVGMIGVLFATHQSSFIMLAQYVFESAGVSAEFCGALLGINVLVGLAVQLICSNLLRQTDSGATQRTSNEAQEDGTKGDDEGCKKDYSVQKCKDLLCAQAGAFLLYALALNAHLLPGALGSLAKAYLKWPIVVCSLLDVVTIRRAAPRYNEQTARMAAECRIAESTVSAAYIIPTMVLFNMCASAFAWLKVEEVDEFVTQKFNYAGSFSLTITLLMLVVGAYLFRFEGKTNVETRGAVGNNNKDDDGLEEVELAPLPGASAPAPDEQEARIDAVAPCGES